MSSWVRYVGHGKRYCRPLILHLFFPLLTLLSQRSLSPVSNSLYPLAFVLHSPPTLSISLFESSHRIIGLPRILFFPLSGRLVSLPIVHIPFFPHVRPVSAYFSPVSFAWRRHYENCSGYLWRSPRYRAERVTAYVPYRKLRSVDQALVVERFGRWAFSCAGPSLPLHLITKCDPGLFRKDLNTFFCLNRRFTKLFT